MRTSLTKLFLLSAGCAIALVATSFAGPMPTEKNVTPMAPAPACDWTGFYVGANAGIVELQSRFTDLNQWGYDNEGEVSGYGTITFEAPAFIGGGQVGYNYQWRDLVLGIEADFSGLPGAVNHQHMNHSESSGGAENYGVDDKGKVDFMSTLRARIGISFLDNKAMIYATGGAAYAHGDWDSYAFYYTPFYRTNYGYTYDAEWKGDDWRWGWTGGFGLEYALDCHWSIRGEALYTWLEADTKPMTGPKDSLWYQEGYRPKYRFEDDLWSYRVGINYKFSGFFGAR
jgi:outer membrane immunogenic protein